jgi:hypothetical protein
MGSLEKLKGELVHSRTIDIRSYAVDEERLLVEGVLRDERPCGIYTLTGQKREAGPVHGMLVRLLVGGMPARILEAEAEMFKAPNDECREALHSIKKLQGLPIVYGFTREVKDRLGGTAGCTHLATLVLTLGGAAVQGMAAYRARQPVPPEVGQAMLDYLKNSCLVWREDGKAFREASRKRPQS